MSAVVGHPRSERASPLGWSRNPASAARATFRRATFAISWLALCRDGLEFRASQGSCQGRRDARAVAKASLHDNTRQGQQPARCCSPQERQRAGDAGTRLLLLSRATATAKSNPSAVGSRSGPPPGAPACRSTELRKSRVGQSRLRRVPDWNDLDRVDAGHAAGHPDRPDRSDAGVSDDYRGARARLREAVTTRSRSRRLRVRAAKLQRVGRHQYVLSSGCQRVIVTGE